MPKLAKTLATTLLMLSSSSWAAGSFPEKPLTIVVPFSAGGTTDIFTRTLAEPLSKTLGQPVIIENKPGANGIVAAQYVARSKPDGYTLLMTIAGVFRQPYVQPMDFNPVEDLTFIAMTNEFALSVVVREDSPWRSMTDMVQAAKRQPGSVFYGVPALMGTQDLAMIDLAQKESLEWTAVPFKGDSQSLVALVSDEIQASITAGNVSAPFEQSRKVRVLASLNDQRSDTHPAVPTWREEGFKVAASTAAGISGPASMKPEVVQVLSNAIGKALEDPALVKRAKEMGAIPRYMNASEYTEYSKELSISSKDLIAQALKRR